MSAQLAIAASRNDDARIVQFIDLDQFSQQVQDLHENGSVYGAYARLDGAVVVVDIWGDEHVTSVEVDAINRPNRDEQSRFALVRYSIAQMENYNPVVVSEHDTPGEAEEAMGQHDVNVVTGYLVARIENDGSLTDWHADEPVDMPTYD